MQPFMDFHNANTNAVLIKTSFKVDLESLQHFFNEEVKPLRKKYQGTKTWHGGWSVQSNTGEIDDGWQPGGSLIKVDESGKPAVDLQLRDDMFPEGQDFVTPTMLYKGVAEEMIMGMASTGFTPKRTRFSELEPGGRDPWHRDGIRGPFWRGHIVVDTNPNCFFWWKSNDGQRVIRRHIPADGHLYMARVDYLHRITNMGSTDRIHVLVDSRTPLRLSRLWVEPVAFLDV